MTMNALLTGATGQDGRHLTKLLLSKNYQVFALIRDIEGTTSKEFQALFPSVKIFAGQLNDSSSLRSAITNSSPTEIYNLAAISHVGRSDLSALETTRVNGLGPVQLFETIRALGLTKTVKIYQASSSEIFGRASQAPQNETTQINPISPYGIAKAFAHQNARFYRENYGMRIALGILYNHEGEFRRHEYVTRKISSNIARIKLGRIEKFALGDIDAERDWGYAGDYVEAIWKMMQTENPSEYVIATGKTHSVKEFLIEALTAADLSSDFSNFVDLDTKLLRPLATRKLVGDSRKAQVELDWEPRVGFKELLKIMVSNDLAIENSK